MKGSCNAKLILRRKLLENRNFIPWRFLGRPWNSIFPFLASQECICVRKRAFGNERRNLRPLLEEPFGCNGNLAIEKNLASPSSQYNKTHILEESLHHIFSLLKITSLKKLYLTSLSLGEINNYSLIKRRIVIVSKTSLLKINASHIFRCRRDHLSTVVSLHQHHFFAEKCLSSCVVSNKFLLTTSLKNASRLFHSSFVVISLFRKCSASLLGGNRLIFHNSLHHHSLHNGCLSQKRKKSHRIVGSCYSSESEINIHQSCKNFTPLCLLLSLLLHNYNFNYMKIGDHELMLDFFIISVSRQGIIIFSTGVCNFRRRTCRLAFNFSLKRKFSLQNTALVHIKPNKLEERKEWK